VRELAFTAVRTSAEAGALMGTPIEQVGGFSSSAQPGRMLVRFSVSGPHGSALVEAHARETNAGWELDRVIVTPSTSGVPLVVLPRQRL
jgi:hypothetical protein